MDGATLVCLRNSELIRMKPGRLCDRDKKEGEEELRFSLIYHHTYIGLYNKSGENGGWVCYMLYAE